VKAARKRRVVDVDVVRAFAVEVRPIANHPAAVAVERTVALRFDRDVERALVVALHIGAHDVVSIWGPRRRAHLPQQRLDAGRLRRLGHGRRRAG
jgi:O-acetylhomoserine/O-acetylserine sulfhydrylase-like pyridoxal-dependent enzyme